MGADISMVAIMRIAPHAPDESRDHVKAKIKNIHIGNLAPGLLAQHIKACIGQI